MTTKYRLMFFIWLCLLFFSLLSSCEPEENEQAADKLLVARVGDKYLYLEDVEGLFYEGVSSQDSIELLRRYADSWIKKELLLIQALEEEAISEEELKKQLEDYKFQLLSYAYQKKYIEDRLDTTITDKEVQTFYNENTDNFKLKQTIVRAYFLHASPEAPKREDLFERFTSDKAEDMEELKSYAYGFASKHALNPEQWFPLKQLIDNTPLSLKGYPKKNQFLSTEDSTGLYLLRILDVRMANQPAPLSYVEDKIKATVINKRKVELQKEIEERIYRDAKQNSKYEILVK